MAEQKKSRKDFMANNHLEKIRVKTVLRALKEFGATVF